MSTNKNLVYCAPTSGGKTFIAEILMLRHIFASRNSKVLFIVPYVSIATEKTNYFKQVFTPQGSPTDYRISIKSIAGKKGVCGT